MLCPYAGRRTAVHFGEYAKRTYNVKDGNTEDFTRSASISDLDPHKHLSDPSLSQIISQDRLTLEHLLLNHDVLSEISNGSFGVVYHFRLKNEDMVLKINKRMLEARLVTVDGSVLRYAKDLNHYEQRIKNKAVAEFEKEAEFARRALVPSLAHAPVVGDPMPDKNFDEFLKIYAQRLKMKSHPGFEHIHKILHFAPEFPFILSETCVSTLKDSPIKTEDQFRYLIHDIGNAILYLEEIAGFYHLDIKPANILYKIKEGRLWWVLADFGICIDTDAVDLLETSHGTHFYNRCRFDKTNPETYTPAKVVSILGLVFSAVEMMLESIGLDVWAIRHYPTFIQRLVQCLLDNQTFAPLIQLQSTRTWHLCKQFTDQTIDALNNTSTNVFSDNELYFDSVNKLFTELMQSVENITSPAVDDVQYLDESTVDGGLHSHRLTANGGLRSHQLRANGGLPKYRTALGSWATSESIKQSASHALHGDGSAKSGSFGDEAAIREFFGYESANSGLPINRSSHDALLGDGSARGSRAINGSKNKFAGIETAAVISLRAIPEAEDDINDILISHRDEPFHLQQGQHTLHGDEPFHLQQVQHPNKRPAADIDLNDYDYDHDDYKLRRLYSSRSFDPKSEFTYGWY